MMWQKLKCWLGYHKIVRAGIHYKWEGSTVIFYAVCSACDKMDNQVATIKNASFDDVQAFFGMVDAYFPPEIKNA
jgi:hypothetical protein